MHRYMLLISIRWFSPIFCRVCLEIGDVPQDGHLQHLQENWQFFWWKRFEISRYMFLMAFRSFPLVLSVFQLKMMSDEPRWWSKMNRTAIWLEEMVRNAWIQHRYKVDSECDTFLIWFQDISSLNQSR